LVYGQLESCPCVLSLPEINIFPLRSAHTFNMGTEMNTEGFVGQVATCPYINHKGYGIRRGTWDRSRPVRTLIMGGYGIRKGYVGQVATCPYINNGGYAVRRLLLIQ